MLGLATLTPPLLKYVKPHTKASNLFGDTGSSGVHVQSSSSKSAKYPTWWTSPLSYKSAIGSARTALPLVAQTIVTGISLL